MPEYMNPLGSRVASHIKNIKDSLGRKSLLLKPNESQTVRNKSPKDSIRLKGFTNVSRTILAAVIYTINTFNSYYYSY